MADKDYTKKHFRILEHRQNMLVELIRELPQFKQN
jgi:hypothetical protein